MARARRSTFLEVSGPLFEASTSEIKAALAAGMRELGEVGVPIMQEYIRANGFVRTGAFVGSVHVEVHRSRGAGWVKVYPDAAFPRPGRPSRTWMETGVRRGSRPAKRTGGYAFRKTARRLNAMKYDGFVLPRLVEALGGD